MKKMEKNNNLLRKKGNIQNIAVGGHNFIPQLLHVCWMNEQDNAQ